MHCSGFAECHRIKPISTLLYGERTRTSDLVIVCVNCHGMLHCGKNWLSVVELMHVVETHAVEADFQRCQH
ncbi:hypothetical protein KBY99_00385 [Cyanobium sp. Maggiore-St4-Cus]|nr:hypothetical protein [Cyanobium sp. Maggiore-St4-Cus]